MNWKSVIPSANAGNGNGVSGSAQNEFKGVLVLNTGAVAMGPGVQQVALQPIPNFYGLPQSRFNLEITAVDTTGATIPSGVTGVSTAVYEFQIYGKSGQLLIDSKGMDNDFINVGKILNPYGFYTAETVPTESAVSTPYTNTYASVYGLSIDANEYPLTPVVTINSLSSRATTLNGLTSTVQVKMYADYEAHPFVRAKLRSYPITGITTGIIPVQAQLDKGVNILSQMYYFGSDSNLSNSSTFSFANNGIQLINATSKATAITQENNVNPSNPHIAGLFPLNVLHGRSWNSNYSSVLQFNIASAPTIGGVANIVKAYLLEQY